MKEELVGRVVVQLHGTIHCTASTRETAQTLAQRTAAGKAQSWAVPKSIVRRSRGFFQGGFLCLILCYSTNVVVYIFANRQLDAGVGASATDDNGFNSRWLTSWSFVRKLCF